MAIIFNNTEIQELWFNGVQLQEAWFNGVQVLSGYSGEVGGLFYAGDSWGGRAMVTRINASGTLVGPETNVGTVRGSLAGATVGGNGLFYGGVNISKTHYNHVTRINASGTLVGSETTLGTVRRSLAGATVGVNGLFYGGYIYEGTSSTHYNSVTRINASGAMVGSERNVGTTRYDLAGATVGVNGLFYGGIKVEGTAFSYSDHVTRINSSGAMVGSETNIGTFKRGLAGATVGGNGLFYGDGEVTRINASGTLVGPETNVGTVRGSLAGATVGGNGLFYGGFKASTEYNRVTRINASGDLVGSETNVGTIRINLAGASL